MKKRTIFVLLTVLVLFVCASPLMQKKVQAEEDQYQYAKVGTPVTFTANAGFSVKSYQWQYSDDNGEKWTVSTEEGATTSQIQITMSMDHHKRMYRCKVTPTSGSAVYSNNFVLRALPSWSQHPQGAVGKVREKVSMLVEAYAPEGVVSYQWQYSNDGGASWKNSAAAGAKTDTITITVKSSYYGLYYRCVATDIYGKNSSSNWGMLNVQPEIKSHPENQNGKVGNTVQFSVQFAGAHPQYQWQYSNDGGATWKNSTAAGNKTSVLKVVVKAGYNGLRYRCVITEVNGLTLNSRAATLKVNAAITRHPENKTVNAGEIVQFSVGASGAGLKYQWQYSNNGGKTWTNSAASGNKTAALSINVKSNYNGLRYRCVITDANGTVLTSDPARLTVK